jgi:hypothetical protein
MRCDLAFPFPLYLQKTLGLWRPFRVEDSSQYGYLLARRVGICKHLFRRIWSRISTKYQGVTPLSRFKGILSEINVS